MTIFEAQIAQFGSPLYVYEMSDIDASFDDLRRQLPSPSTLYYSLKANPHPAIAERLRRLGCRAEVSSPGELNAALAGGFDGEQCLYTGPGKIKAEIVTAIRAGVRRFSVESTGDFARVADVAAGHAVTAECLLRVNPPQAVGSSGVRMTGTPSQFGVDLEALLAAPESFANRVGAVVVGVHLYAISNARDEQDLIAALSASIAIAAQLRDTAGYPMSVVDLGGGFAAPYARPGTRPSYSSLAPAIEAQLDEHLPGWRDGAVEVAFESGRYLVGDCGALACTVTDVKVSRGKRFIVLDSGINHLGGMSGLGRFLPAAAEPLPGARGADSAPGALVGPLCTPADLLARDVDTGDLRPGDVVVVPNVGAYGLTASLIAFLSHPIPTEIVLDHGQPVSVSRMEVHRVPARDGSGPPLNAVAKSLRTAAPLSSTREGA